jgi:hypothetical protein
MQGLNPRQGSDDFSMPPQVIQHRARFRVIHPQAPGKGSNREAGLPAVGRGKSDNCRDGVPRLERREVEVVRTGFPLPNPQPPVRVPGAQDNTSQGW